MEAKYGGACDADSVDLGHTLDLSDQIRGRAVVVRQRGGDNNLKYDRDSTKWGPECRLFYKFIFYIIIIVMELLGRPGVNK